MVVSFNPKFKIGEIVSPVIEPEIKVIVLSYSLMNIGETGDVVFYYVNCSAPGGGTESYREFELEKQKQESR